MSRGTVGRGLERIGDGSQGRLLIIVWHYYYCYYYYYFILAN